MSLLPTFSSYDRGKLVSQYGAVNLEKIEITHDAYMHLLASSPLDQRKPAKLFRRFSRTIITDLRGMIATYSSLADRILSSAQYTSEDTQTGVFVPEMKKTPIFMEYLHFFHTGDASTLKFVHTFLVFAKKLALDFKDLQSVAFREWLGIEKEMESFKTDAAEMRLLRAVISQLLLVDNFHDELLLPKHGGGQVAEKVRDIRQKFDLLAVPPKIAKCFAHGRFVIDHWQRDDLLELVTPWVGSSVVMFAAKSYKTYRSVCMEPAVVMYFQQEVMRWLVDCIHQSPIGRFVDLRSQILNQQYAYVGSANFSLDTIDLSAASDRIHTDIVKAVFPSKIAFYLMGTRTSTVTLPDGKLHTMKKFSPMGSATCFPVQCVLFTAITVIGYLMRLRSCTLTDLVNLDPNSQKLMVQDLLGHLSDNFRAYGRALRSPRVYGDDIICDSRVTEHVTRLLEHFGLKVNMSKSFTGGQCVRESCGIFAFNGEDVTPMYLRVKDGHRGIFDPSAFVSLVAVANAAGDFGFSKVQSYIIRYMRARYLRLLQPSRSGKLLADLPFTEDKNSFGIWTKRKHPPVTVREHTGKSTHSHRVGKKVTSAWHILEELALSVVGEKARVVGQDAYYYDQWMRSKIRGESEGFKMPSSGIFPLYMRLSRGWTPVRI
jgi:hypothetical protein